MSTYTYRLTGSFETAPAVTPASGCLSGSTPFDEVVILQREKYDEYDLTVDSPVTINFGGLTEAHVVFIKSDYKVTVRITSADGSTQSIPVEGFFKLLTKGDTPITAIDLTRVAGQVTNVKVFLGEKS